VDKVGERYFFGAFSLLSIAGLMWFVFAYRMAPFVPLCPTIPALGWLVFVLVFLGFLLAVLGSGPMNPTDTRGPRTIDSKLPVYGITRVTRHPRLCGVSLWAIAHLLVNGQLAALLIFGSLLVTTVNGMMSIDRKRRRALGALWDEFEKRTSRLPFAAILTGRTHFELGELRIWQVALAVGFSRVFSGYTVLSGHLRSLYYAR
jgi:uncharacterized membrane protein